MSTSIFSSSKLLFRLQIFREQYVIPFRDLSLSVHVFMVQHTKGRSTSRADGMGFTPYVAAFAEYMMAWSQLKVHTGKRGGFLCFTDGQPGSTQMSVLCHIEALTCGVFIGGTVPLPVAMPGVPVCSLYFPGSQLLYSTGRTH